MKRSRFHLTAVMRVRRIQEDIELGRLAKARIDLAAELSKEETLTTAYQNAVHVSPAGTSTQRFLGDRSRADRMGEQVMTARAQVVEARCEEVHRRDEWAVAAQRVSALDRLFDRFAEARAASIAADEVVDTDEQTMQRRSHLARAATNSPARNSSTQRPTSGEKR